METRVCEALWGEVGLNGLDGLRGGEKGGPFIACRPGLSGTPRVGGGPLRPGAWRAGVEALCDGLEDPGSRPPLPCLPDPPLRL